MGGGRGYKYSSEERNGTGKCGSHDEVFFLFFFSFFSFCFLIRRNWVGVREAFQVERGCVYVYVYGMGWESEVIYDIYTT